MEGCNGPPFMNGVVIMINDLSTVAAREFSERAKAMRTALQAAVEDDVVRISEEHFKAVLLPIFTLIAADEHPSLDPWFTLAGNQHKVIHVHASIGGQYGELFDPKSEPLFIVPPILEQFEPSKENQGRAFAIVANSNPDMIPQGMNGSVAHDLVTMEANRVNVMSGFQDQDRVMSRAILFGVAMYDRYNLPWFTDPETNKRYSKPVDGKVETKNVTQDEVEYDIGDLDEL